MTVQGTGFTEFDSLVFDGFHAGRLEVDINAYDPISGAVVGWIPLQIVNDPGTYTVMVRTNGVLSGSKSFVVTKPAGGKFTLHLPEVLTAISKGRTGAAIRYEVAVSGASGTPDISCEPASGASFPLGRSLVRCTAYDGIDRDTGTIEVNVVDATPPVLTLPKPYQVEADSQEGSYLKYETAAADEVDGALEVSCFPKSGEFVRPGKTVVNCESLDNSFNSAFGSFEVLVVPRDLGKLAIQVPEVLKVMAQSKYGAVVEFDEREVYAYGSADPDPVVQCTPASGTDFRMGETKVYCTAVDDFDQRAEAGFIVSVSDEYSLKMDDVSAEANGPDGADVTYELKAEDWKNEIQCSPAPGTRFAMGATDVECTSVNDDGRKGVGRFKVEVADTIPPHISRAEAKAGAVDRGFVPVSVEVDALDAADAMPRCSVVDLVADTTDGFDWRSRSELELEIRSDAPRAMRLLVSCADAAGNRSTATVPVAIERTGSGRGTKVQ